MFLSYLKDAKVPLVEYDFSKTKLCNIQEQYEKLIETNYYLNTSAREAFKSFLQSYGSHKNKEIFNVETLDLASVCHSFGFSTPPPVNLDISGKRSGPKGRNNSRIVAAGYQSKKQLILKKRQLMKNQNGENRQFVTY